MSQINFSPFPTLHTSRLVLRRPVSDDDIALSLLRSDEVVNKYLERPKSTTPAEARAFLEKINAGINAGIQVYWIIVLQGQSDLAGTVCLWNFSADGTQAEIGYELVPRYQGMGIMREAVERVIRYGFETLDLQHINACLTTDNSRSRRLLEKQGFVIDPVATAAEAGENLAVYTLARI
jgi:ribosomal-protein-alanine N-acetyltransferase